MVVFGSEGVLPTSPARTVGFAAVGPRSIELESGGGSMRDYEAMVIVDARLEEGEIQKAVDKLTSVITDSGGKVGKVDRWGNRRFAYEIAHQFEGYYFVAEFSAPEATVEQLKRTLQISDEYIRGKILRPEGAQPEQKSA